MCVSFVLVFIMESGNKYLTLNGHAFAAKDMI